MNDKREKNQSNSQRVRVSKDDRKDLKGKTNWASLISEERKEAYRKS